MPEQGYVTEVNVDPQGSELDQDALSTDTVLYLGDASEYDPGEVVEINDQRHTVVEADVDAGTITLTAPLGAPPTSGSGSTSSAAARSPTTTRCRWPSPTAIRSRSRFSSAIGSCGR